MNRSLDRRSFLAAATQVALAASLAPSNMALAAQPAKRKTGYAYTPRFAGYYQNSAEVPDRVVWIDKRIHSTGLYDELVTVKPLDDPLPYMRKVHTDEHIKGIQSIGPMAGYAEGMGTIAELAVAYALGAVRDVCQGTLDNAFCAIRPPGHHVVNQGYSAGYCCYANVVIAARYAMQEFGIKRVLIIDTDYHHGNSTHSFVCDDPAFLFFETYGSVVYGAGCGTIPDVSGRDNTLNVEMPCGSINDRFCKVWDDYLTPLAERFQPELVLMSAGFDLKKYDSHGCFELTAQGFSQLTKKAMNVAEKYCSGKFVSMLEGGYRDVLPGDSYSAPETFYGLAGCAERHARTLLTGEVQPEAEWYSTGIGAARTEEANLAGPRLVNGVLQLSPDVAQVRILDLHGRSVRVFDRAAMRSGKLELRSLGLARGRYAAVCGSPRGKTSEFAFASPVW